MILDVTIEEAQDIAKVLANLPTSSGAYPLFVKIAQQVEAELKKDDSSA
jgi:hypothetical protein